MLYISLPDNKQRRLSFYLAMEEYVAKHIDNADCFFMWQVAPSVIFGRNQLIETEVNVGYCREHGIQTYRRKSGGGCVYADMSNVMFSYITKDEAVNFTFNKYINMVVMVLQRLGVEARASGRNDIMIGSRKVSGNAFYHVPGRSIVHGTMLYDTDMRNMVGAITPSTQKLTSKGISSVRQRIALLKDYIHLDIEEFKTFVKNNLCDEELLLSASQIEEINEIEKEYLSPDFIYGNNPRYTITKSGHIENVGNIEVRLEMKNNVIRSMTMLGDFFITGNIDDGIIKPLKNKELTAESLSSVLPTDLSHIVMNLDRDSFVELLLKNE